MAARLPPEWAPQSATLLAWPHAGGGCRPNLDAVRDTIACMAATLAARQDVILIAADEESRDSITAHPDLARAGSRLHPFQCPIDDIWARDYGPVTVFEGGRRVFVDCRFDGWHRRYPADNDDRAAAVLHAAGAFGAGELERESTVLEGGSIESDGAGTLLTTQRCLLDNSRNPGMDAAAFEALFARRFGADTVHWLRHGGLVGDDTDGHIDTLARFAAPDLIVYQGCDHPGDPHFQPLAEMAEELRRLRDRQGRPYRLQPLPLPAPVHDPDDGRRLPAGYANFLIANGCVLMPAYGDPADERARAALGRCFPGREIVPVDCRALIRHNGALHCIAMQIPAIPQP